MPEPAMASANLENIYTGRKRVSGPSFRVTRSRPSAPRRGGASTSAAEGRAASPGPAAARAAAGLRRCGCGTVDRSRASRWQAWTESNGCAILP